MSLQEVLKKYESKKRQREKELQGLRNDLDKGIE
jgi:Skp family chaperone for outer membrane proteins